MFVLKVRDIMLKLGVLVISLRHLYSILSFMIATVLFCLFLLIPQPVPFPLIQMARTLLFLYVFTVPFVMLSDNSSNVAHCFTVFLLTYGFVGLEMVAIELDNPFGHDPNDFNNKYVFM